MGVVSACAFSFMSKYLHQSCGPKPMTRVDINDNNQSSNMHNLFLKDTCKMVIGSMVLMKGVNIGTVYNLLGNVNSTGCNNITVPKIDSNLTRLDLTRLSQFNPNRQVLFKMNRPCYGTRGWDILEKKDFELCITKVWLNIFLNLIDFCEHLYMEKQIG
jgi:hypothetical protein